MAAHETSRTQYTGTQSSQVDTAKLKSRDELFTFLDKQINK